MPAAAVEIGAPRVDADGDGFRISVDLRIDGQRRDWYFRTTAPTPPATVDAFVAAALAPTMKLGGPLVVEGPVSDAFLARVAEIQRVFEVWRVDEYHDRYRTFRRIEVHAQQRAEPLVGDGVGAFFSGGVDSFDTLLRLGGDLTALLFIDDFEHHFEPDLRDAVADNVRRVADASGLPLIRVETNSRDLFLPYVSRQYQGSFLTSVALLHAPELAVVHLSTSVDLSMLTPWGTHPMLDGLFSAGGQRIEHGPIDVTRFEKVQRIADSPLALEHLRVCWNPAFNCGRCHKCVRTMLALHAIDRLDDAVTLPADLLTPALVTEVMRTRPGSYEYLEEIGYWLQGRGLLPEYVAAIKAGRTVVPPRIARTHALSILAPEPVRRAVRRMRTRPEGTPA
jgi:hypothetical protein